MPILDFFVTDLTDMVFLAGPNGVGKSRLIERLLQFLKNPRVDGDMCIKLEATSSVEVESWGSRSLSTSDATDCQKLQGILHQNKSRRNFRSSILYYESNRQITNLKPLQASWEYEDPYVEKVGWDFSFQPLRGRAQDTIHSLFKKIQSQKASIANRAIKLRGEGKDSMQLLFDDPLEPFKDAFEQLLAPKKLLGIGNQGNSLRIEDGEREITEGGLSSGEREVLNIVFDFLLRQPSDCVVFFDEPELHLHPELSNKLLSTLKTIGEGNQFIFCTHSAELLSGSLDNTVIFIQPQAESGENQAVPVTAANEEYAALKAIGQSIGVVSLGKKIVLIEGTKSSLDKKTYLHIIKGQFPNLVLVPCEGKYTLQSFGHIADSVLSRTIWGVSFFMLSDRDAFPDELSAKIQDRGLEDRVKSLSRYHLENYFLDEEIISGIFSEMEDEGSWLCDPLLIESKLREIATDRIGYATALNTSKFLRDSAGNVDLMVKGCQSMSANELSEAMKARAHAEIERVQAALGGASVATRVQKTYESFSRAIKDGSWKNSIPGKQVLSLFCKQTGMDQDRFKTLYIRKAMSLPLENNPFEEILSVFAEFSGLDQPPSR